MPRGAPGAWAGWNGGCLLPRVGCPSLLPGDLELRPQHPALTHVSQGPHSRFSLQVPSYYHPEYLELPPSFPRVALSSESFLPRVREDLKI